MTVDRQIQQLDKQDFLEYLYQLQILAKEKFSFDIFIENRLSQNNKFEENNKRKIDFTACLDLGGQLDDINIRELAYE